MRVILDEGVPQPLVAHFPGHDVRTVAGQGWAAIKNGKLLTLIEDNGFQVFITGDKNLRHQQSPLVRPFATLIVSAISWPVLRQHLPSIETAVDQATPGTIVHVACGEFVSRRKSKLEGPRT